MVILLQYFGSDITVESRKFSNFRLFSDYLRELQIWFNQLFPRIIPHLYANGGPIIMVQSENEYGLFGCDHKYKQWLQDEIIRHVGDKVVLFTADPPGAVKCGKIESALATAHFGVG